MTTPHDTDPRLLQAALDVAVGALERAAGFGAPSRLIARAALARIEEILADAPDAVALAVQRREEEA